MIPRLLLVFPESCLRFVPRQHCRPLLVLVLALAHCFPLRLGVLQLLFDFLLALDNPAGDVSVDRIHQLAFLEHLPGDDLAREEPAEVLDRHLLLKAVAGFVEKEADLLAQDVVEPANLVRVDDIKMGRQVRHSALPLVAEPGRRGYLLPDLADY